MVQQVEDHLVIYPGAGKQLEGLLSPQWLVIDDEQIQPNVVLFQPYFVIITDYET